MKNIYDLFFLHKEVAELRCIGLNGSSSFWQGYAKGIISGYFDDAVSMDKAALALDNVGATGVYFTINPVNPALLARAVNRLIVPKNTTQDSDIMCIRWFPLDLDPIRPAGISATDEEVNAAIELSKQIVRWLENKWGFTHGIRAFSGNGVHLLYRLPDLPNNHETHDLIVRTMESIIAHFKNDKVDIDSKITNPSRILKYYGTVGRKGDSTPDRPHRKSFIYAE